MSVYIYTIDGREHYVKGTVDEFAQELGGRPDAEDPLKVCFDAATGASLLITRAHVAAVKDAG